jgi:hypothetical protein
MERKINYLYFFYFFYNTRIPPKVLRAPNRKVAKAVRKTNPLKNIRAMIKLNPYSAVMKKNAELVAAKNIRAKVGFIFFLL